MDSLFILLLPYIVSAALKLSDIFLDRRIMSQTLSDLVRQSGPGPDGMLKLGSGEQNVIISFLTHASLKTSGVLTCFTSSFAFLATILLERPVFSHMGLLLLALFLFGIALLIWVLPQSPGYFDGKNRLGIERGTLATLLFCLYDIALAVTVSYLHFSKPQAGQPPIAAT